MGRRIKISPHKWGIVRKTFNHLQGRFYERIISRHKTDVAAKGQLKFFGTGGDQTHFVRRLTKKERVDGSY